MVLAPRTSTANQDRHGGKRGTDNPEHSRIHSSLPSIDFTAAELSGPRINYFFNVAMAKSVNVDPKSALNRRVSARRPLPNPPMNLRCSMSPPVRLGYAESGDCTEPEKDQTQKKVTRTPEEA
jgi:hypothetical protein